MSDAGISSCQAASISPVISPLISPDDGEVSSPVMSPAAKTDLTPPVKARRGREASQPVVERMEAELARWVNSVQSLEERQPLGTKFRTFIPLRCGSKAVESHSMHERGFNYRGQEDFMKKPHGSGEVVFSNGDIYSGQGGFHFKLNKKASQKASKEGWKYQYAFKSRFGSSVKSSKQRKGSARAVCYRR